LSKTILLPLFTQNTNANVGTEIDNRLAAIESSIDEGIKKDPKLGLSSNPYDYIRNDENFNAIVALKSDALPALQAKLSKSTENALPEYIMAIAIERISKTDLKKSPTDYWASGKDFTVKWNKHLKSIPTVVDNISKSNKENSDKVKELIELGTPAIPFISDKVEEGKEDLYPALAKLLDSNEEITNKKEWVSKNKSKFKDLKDYVLNQK
jgi:hypothetical protein